MARYSSITSATTGEGVGRLFAPGSLTSDGPFPEHYEPMESPVKNALSATQNDPAVHLYKDAVGTFAAMDPEFPYVATTYRVTEHEHFVTQNVPYLVESMWGEGATDIYLTDATTGTRKLIKQKSDGQGQLSPGAKYVTWFQDAGSRSFVHEFQVR